MKFYKIQNPRNLVSLKEAVLTGIQGSSGLFMPETLPHLEEAFLSQLPSLTLQEIGVKVAKQFLGADLENKDIVSIVENALNFPIPLVNLHDGFNILELFHGPTLAFKDVGARFMARLFAYLLKNENQELHILVATSGDTGGAVASAFHDVEGIKVTILYPGGKVSLLQEKQLTTLGGNVSAIEIEGTFDDCQSMVKQAFADTDLQRKIHLASANSINLARLIPQSFYYFWAVAQLRKLHPHAKPVICVPSGNFGNLTAGLMAKKMGLPVKRFIAATNANDVVPLYLSTAIFNPKPSQQTISNAMDVGNPSNFSRMMELYKHRHASIALDVVAASVSDEQTMQTMQTVYVKYGYLLDPHGAVGFAATEKYAAENFGERYIVFETAHPAKFDEVVQKATGIQPDIPMQLSSLSTKPKVATKMKTDFSELKSFLG